MKCPSCGAEQPDGELVCFECNNYLNLSEEELDRVERFRLSTHTELLCAMFCDISGFTVLANQSLVHSQKILSIHGAIVQAIVERDRAGEVVNTAGDGVLAVFANPAVAVECALRMHEVTTQYYAGVLKDEHVLRALHQAGLKPTPAAHDPQHFIHIGMHLGIVTRGGRTSRDVFGHNVNVACRLCDLASRGQTYMSEAVYDNARLIIGDRADLRWQTWKELPIRGIATPMSVVGVAQQPYHPILPPRGIKLSAMKKPLLRNPLALAGAGLVVVAAIALAISVLGHTPKTNIAEPAPPARPAPTATPAEETLPPVVATFSTLPDEPEPAAEDTPPAIPAGEQGSASVSTVLAPPSTANESSTATVFPPTVAPDAPKNPPLPPADREVRRALPILLRGGAPIALGAGPDKRLTGTLNVMRGKEALLIAVGVDVHAEGTAAMTLLVDGNSDGKLNSESDPPIFDVLLRRGGPGGDTAGLQCLSLKDGKPATPLAEPKGYAARAVHHSNRTIWVFRVPLDDLGASSGMYVKFRAEYQPDGPEGAPLYHPPSPTGTQLREIAIP